MLFQYHLCKTDDDFVQYTLFFVRYRSEFSRRFSLSDALMHALETIQTSHIMLLSLPTGEVIGWAQYRYFSEGYEPDPNGDIVFVDSAITLEPYRSTRLFIQGFRVLAAHIAQENPLVRTFQFCALADNAYLKRLYSKFADIIGQREGYHGTEDLFSTDFPKLLQYLSPK
ncbi:hypothetical protein [Paenibacillus rigui]|uniref:GNAT family N-acetyltransferase n=1 Tax=Paenibacillus rigui TaxID=554312 RepID=A0A229UR92_9BACL|nr:hypothetical protein [Paenibacillus rigui]OXM85705.1 GNAT family N-acetyltransferase [Paenibacillus rigui]